MSPTPFSLEQNKHPPPFGAYCLLFGLWTDEASDLDNPEAEIPPPQQSPAAQTQQNRLTMGRGVLGGSAKALGSSSALPSAPTASPPAPPPAPVPTPTPTPAAVVKEVKVAVPAAAAAGVPVRVPVTHPHEALITAQPEMLSCTLTPEDEFVLLACDGLFDVFSSDEVRVFCFVFVREVWGCGAGVCVCALFFQWFCLFWREGGESGVFPVCLPL